MLKIINESKYNPEIKHLETGAIFQLPHGSGIDADWISNGEQGACISFCNEWHALDNNGCYCGWVPFEVIVRYDLDKQRFDYSVTVDDGQIQSIVEGYEENVDDNGDIETNAPYLDDLADIIHSSIESWNCYLPKLRRQQQIARKMKIIESSAIDIATSISIVYGNISVEQLQELINERVSKSANQNIKDLIFNMIWPMLTAIAQNKKEE